MDELDDEDGTAEYLKVAPRTMQDWRYKGLGPPWVRVGGQIRYRRVDVETWLTGRRNDPMQVA